MAKPYRKMNYMINGLMTDIVDIIEDLEEQGINDDQVYNATYLLLKVEQMQHTYVSILSKRLKELSKKDSQ